MIYPGARWRPISHNLGGQITPRAVVWHTAVDGGSTSSLFDWFNNPARNGTSAHGFIAADGSMEQYADTSRLCGHAWAANSFALGIETHDGGHPEQPWSAGQVARMIDFMRWCRDHLGIPIRPIDGPAGSGHGFHQEFVAWNQNAHNCPGPVRVRQLATVIEWAARPAGNVAPTPPPPAPAPLPVNLTVPTEDTMLKFMCDNHRGAIILVLAGDTTYREFGLAGEDIAPLAAAGVPSANMTLAGLNRLRASYGQAAQ